MSRRRRKLARRRRALLVNQDLRRVDLHMHSNLSDGLLAPLDVLQKCVTGGLDIISITDHDMIPSLRTGIYRIGEKTIRAIAGVEFSAQHIDKEIHILAYFGQEIPQEAIELCHETLKNRVERYDNMVDLLGLEGVEYAPPEARSGKLSVTRLHLAKAIVKAGHANTTGEVFSRWLGSHNKIEHFPTVQELLARFKGLPVFCAWAHPRLEDLHQWGKDFVSYGLDGVEALRASKGKKYTQTIKEFARQNKIHVTGGSDHHGWGNPLGSFSFPAQEIRDWACDLACIDSPQ